ncbi:MULTISPECIES: hypothetical protein [Micromonospora]|uniref:Uncharacterized protein n=1 Tax=Micromonospora solifontis TaxID=2487138 RepID=A0ABX9WFS3_9ACTN|nr:MULTISPECIES: hypothetical protein [Micromonospora]NES16297.1 hypothetical protein [Micromonospora sp. PPF5-17B]NES38357.1 hypothetical protein [Micromonospora solifontis]NES58109.1 hypothetical protein [Micromonospora sp. PPF5-6]RNL95888.1 hypothetical protein EFE23_19715 [Micromonospora solifontis]
MFALLSTLLEVVSAHAGRLFDGRRTARDSEVAEHLLEIVLAVQELCVRGDRLLSHVDGVLAAADDGDPGRPASFEAERSTEFERLLRTQVAAVDELRTRLGDSQLLLATVDPGFQLDLVPFLDVKSGLLTRWTQQVEQSRYSTTTLFFLPAAELRRVLAVGREHADGGGLGSERTAYLLAFADSLREVRAHELRDIRLPAAREAGRIRGELEAARSDLHRAKALCTQLSDSVVAAVGPEALARLRRRLATR